MSDKGETSRFTDTESHGNELGQSPAYPQPRHVKVAYNPTIKA